MRIALIDYNAGNVFSLCNSIRHLGWEPVLSKEPRELLTADRLILPGVGHFGQAMKQIRELKLEALILDYVKSGKPFLGICVGLQLMFESSEEAPGVSGLGLFSGPIKKFQSGKIPHMGWNEISRCDGGQSGFAYFAHSFYAEPKEPNIAAGWTTAEIQFPSLVHDKNLTAFQFHPEKSGLYGLSLLKQVLAEGKP